MNDRNGIRSKEDSALREVVLAGDWTIASGARLEAQLNTLDSFGAKATIIDSAEIEKLDTLGAWLILRLIKRYEDEGSQVTLRGLSVENEVLLDRIRKGAPEPCERPRRRGLLIVQLEQIGMASLRMLYNLGGFLGFNGLVYARLLGAVRRPKRLRVTPLFYQMEQVGWNALPIVGMIAFLIGAVIVNQGALQLRQFGAEVFVVDMLAISHFRELGVLLTAIIVAGRSGSAFTAQIGSMVLNEEVDAMKTIGLHPIDTLVLPRFLALVLIFPILTFYADLMGALGGGMMAWATLDISPAAFIQRLNEGLLPSTFLVGIIKAPFFASVIAMSGCYEGLSVTGSAESVGEHTTQSVVQSIFLVIVLDALFTVFFTAVDY
jgi:phospholipid/cholesterol/gamma-HCH transport system permease protein